MALVLTVARKHHQRKLKLVSKSTMTNQIRALYQSVSPKTSNKGRNSNFTAETPGRQYLILASASLIARHADITYFLTRWKEQHDFSGLPVKNSIPQSNHARISDKSKVRDTQINDQFCSTMSKSWNKKELSQIRVIDKKKIWKPNATWDPGKDPGAGNEDINGKAGELWIRSVVELMTLCQC